MKTLVLLFSMVLSLNAQWQKTHWGDYLISYLGAPCIPPSRWDGEITLSADLLASTCPPEDMQGLLIHARTERQDAIGFRVSIDYRNREGIRRRHVQLFPWQPADGHSSAALRIGRVNAKFLDGGNTIDNIRVELVALIPGSESDSKFPREEGK